MPFLPKEGSEFFFIGCFNQRLDDHSPNVLKREFFCQVEVGFDDHKGSFLLRNSEILAFVSKLENKKQKPSFTTEPQPNCFCAS